MALCLPHQFQPLCLNLPATSEHFSDGEQEDAVDQLNDEHEEVVVDKLCGFEVMRMFLLLISVLTKEASDRPHVWVVRCDLILARVDDQSDDVDQKWDPLGVKCVVQELLQILPECLLRTSNIEQPPNVETHGVDPEDGTGNFKSPFLI